MLLTTSRPSTWRLRPLCFGWPNQRPDRSTTAFCSNTYLGWPGSQRATWGGIALRYEFLMVATKRTDYQSDSGRRNHSLGLVIKLSEKAALASLNLLRMVMSLM